MYMDEMSPGELVLARSRAFDAGDFAFIYESYHPDSNFRRMFPDRRAYLKYGEEVLSGDFRILECRLLREETSVLSAKVMFYLDTLYRGDRQQNIEVGYFVFDADRWFFMMSERGGAERFAEDPAGIGWDDFERLEDPGAF